MEDSAPRRPGGATPRHGRPRAAGSSVLTPPTGMSSFPDRGPAIPAQRGGTGFQPATPPLDRPAVHRPCACGHGRAAHDHYRPGSDCGACGVEVCAQFRPAGGWVVRVLRRLFPAG